MPHPQARAEQVVAGDPIIHVGWPEHIIEQGELGDDDHMALCLRFIDELARLPVKIVWTMHNRLPHAWSSERGRTLYHAWARAAHAVVHHSRWGMELVRAELPYRADAQHVVIAHGHYQEQMCVTRTRAELERDLALPTCGLRIGLTGRPHKARGLRLIMEAFAASRARELQLLVTAIQPGDWHPDDPRLVVRHRQGWLGREVIVPQINVCDALVVAIDGATYLTSGTHADALAIGIPMIVNQWPFFGEVLGDAALYFDGTPAGLTRLFDQLTAEMLAGPTVAARALRERQSWPVAAAGMVELFGSVARR